MNNTTLQANVRRDISDSLSYCRYTRPCESIPDLDFIHQGIERVLHHYKSGREFIQEFQEQPNAPELSRSTYFNTLHSERRCNLIIEAETVFYKQTCESFQKSGIDHLKKFPELDGYNIVAWDGHYRHHSCHASRDDKGNYRAVGGIVGMNLRYGLVQRLVTTDFSTSKTNEIKAFKKAFTIEECKKSKKTINVLDMAYVDTTFWETCKAMNGNGMYVITLMKDNLKPIEETPLEFDREHPYNVGIQSQSEVKFASGGKFIKIVYTDPETEKTYTYLTTVKGVPPGLIAYLYLWRWKIEKVFDVFKNKFYEKKAWADGKVANDIQMSLIAMAYNILLKTKDLDLAKEGVTETKLEEKRSKQIQVRKVTAKAKGRRLNPLAEIPHKLFQMSAQFIRCFRNQMAIGTLWTDAVGHFRLALSRYL